MPALAMAAGWPLGKITIVRSKTVMLELESLIDGGQSSTGVSAVVWFGIGLHF